MVRTLYLNADYSTFMQTSKIRTLALQWGQWVASEHQWLATHFLVNLLKCQGHFTRGDLSLSVSKDWSA